LKDADPEKWSAAFAPLEGERNILEGAVEDLISFQSIGKIVAYCYLFDLIGDEVHNYVGYSMSKHKYFEDKVDETHKIPFNPFMNNGAIMIAYLLLREGKNIRDILEFYHLTT